MRILVTESQYKNLSESININVIDNYVRNRFTCEFDEMYGNIAFYNNSNGEHFRLFDMTANLKDRFGIKYKDIINTALTNIKTETIDAHYIRKEKSLNESYDDDRVKKRMTDYMNKHFYLKPSDENGNEYGWHWFRTENDKLIYSDGVYQELDNRFNGMADVPKFWRNYSGNKRDYKFIKPVHKDPWDDLPLIRESIDQSFIENYINKKYKCEFHVATGFTVFYNKRDNNKFNIPQMRDNLEERFGESYNEEIYKALLFIRQNAIDSSNRKLHESIATDRLKNNMINYLNKNYYITNKFNSFYNIFQKKDDKLIDGYIIKQELSDRFGLFTNLSISVVVNDWVSKKLKELRGY